MIKNRIDKIIKTRILNMKQIKEFDIWYKKVNKSNDEDDYLEFVWDLMETPFTEYHFSLMVNKNTNV
jgi:hypothetical protein